MNSARITTLVAFAAIALAAACSSTDERPAAGAGSYTNGTPGGNGGGGGGGDDGGSGGSDGSADGGAVDLCKSATQQGEATQELRLAGNAPPPLGGALADGTYVLTEMTAYGANAPADDAGEGGGTTGLTGVVARSTIIVQGTSLVMITGRGTQAAPPTTDTVTGATFVVNGTSLETTSTCPTRGTVKSVPFSAVGGGIALFVDATHRELYTRF